MISAAPICSSPVSCCRFWLVSRLQTVMFFSDKISHLEPIVQSADTSAGTVRSDISSQTGPQTENPSPGTCIAFQNCRYSHGGHYGSPQVLRTSEHYFQILTSVKSVAVVGLLVVTRFGAGGCGARLFTACGLFYRSLTSRLFQLSCLPKALMEARYALSFSSLVRAHTHTCTNAPAL